MSAHMIPIVTEISVCQTPSFSTEEFDKQLEALGLGEAARQQVGLAAAVAEVLANGYVLSQRLDKMTLSGTA